MVGIKSAGSPLGLVVAATVLIVPRVGSRTPAPARRIGPEQSPIRQGRLSSVASSAARAAARAAGAAARAVFSSESDAAGRPTTEVARAELSAGINVADLFNRTGLAASKGVARRLIRGGGARLNNAHIDDEALVVDTAHLQDGQITLSAGRKRHVRVRAV